MPEPDTDHYCQSNAELHRDQARFDVDTIHVPATCELCDYEFELVYTHDYTIDPSTNEEI